MVSVASKAIEPSMSSLLTSASGASACRAALMPTMTEFLSDRASVGFGLPIVRRASAAAPSNLPSFPSPAATLAAMRLRRRESSVAASSPA